MNIRNMNLEELKILNGKKLSIEETEEIDKNDNVINLKNCGGSGLHYGYTWLVYTLTDGEEISIYYK